MQEGHADRGESDLTDFDNAATDQVQHRNASDYNADSETDQDTESTPSEPQFGTASVRVEDNDASDSDDSTGEEEEEEELPLNTDLPMTWDVFEDPELNQFSKEFMRRTVVGGATIASAAGHWELHRKYSRFPTDEMPSFATVRRRVLRCLPAVTVTYSVYDRQRKKTITATATRYPRKKYANVNRYHLLEVWTRMSLRSILRFHLALHPSKARAYIKDGKIDYSKFHLTFTCDGIPSGQSSQYNLHVFCIRVAGCKLIHLLNSRHAFKNHPKKLEDFVGDFIKECNELDVKVDYFLADAPMRAFFKCMKGHAGRYSCETCEAEGEAIKGKIKYPSSTLNQPLRTHASWLRNVRSRLRREPNENCKGITARSPLLDLRNFNIVADCPTDPMHREQLGLTRQLWKLTTNIKSNSVQLRRNAKVIQDEVSNCYRQLSLPNEFSHRARELDVANMKAHEWKAVVMCAFPVIIDTTMRYQDDKIARLWAVYAFLLRVYVSPPHLYGRVRTAALRNYHRELYTLIEEVFGKESCSYNVHSYCHMDENRQAGRQHDISTERFESFYGYIKESHRPGTVTIGKQFMYRTLLRHVDHTEDMCDVKLKIAPRKKSHRYDDSLLVDRDWNFYKVWSNVSGKEVDAERIETDKWSCPQFPRLPFHAVGVKKFVRYSGEFSTKNVNFFTGKAVMYKGNVLMGLQIDSLFS